ncbi:MAG TPA: A/G-specific adenine glycosylase [Allosphingosinicella sp.]|nr:A/G-specific adenine glycosylase [Allosphingosinicella sp.]
MPVDASNALLSWYAVDKRALPWRAVSGETPDPYRVWLSEVMLQQTTVAAVIPYFQKFTGRWPSVEALADADEEEVMTAWAGLGYYARARNLVACARTIVREHGGRFPDTEAELLKLPGIGRYTAAAIAAIAFGRRAVVVDGNVERVLSRLFAVKEPMPAAKARIYELADSITPAAECGDFAQAMMDLGATVCTPRNPSCQSCPLASQCMARAEGEQERYPVKAAKGAKPRRQGYAYWLQHEGHVLLVRRPAKGLLGGMLGLPTGSWSEQPQAGEGAPPAAANWNDAGEVDHVFTHFALNLRLLCAEAGERHEGIWWPVERLEEAGLPTVFAKAAARAASWSRAA